MVIEDFKKVGQSCLICVVSGAHSILKILSLKICFQYQWHLKTLIFEIL